MKNKNANGQTWTQIGFIGIDAGGCWIGDPCYLRPDSNGPDGPAEGSPAGPWVGFINWLGDADAKEHPLGCVVSTGHGDGCYPVEVRRTNDGSIAEVRVRFLGGLERGLISPNAC